MRTMQLAHAGARGAALAWLPKAVLTHPLRPPPCSCCLCSLHEEGLDSERWGAAAQRYINGPAGRQTLDQAVAAIKAAKQEVTDRDARRTRITELFTQQGLQDYLPQQNGWDPGWPSEHSAALLALGACWAYAGHLGYTGHLGWQVLVE